MKKRAVNGIALTKIILSFLLFLIAIVQGIGQNGQPKFALIIGVKSYQFAPALKNTLNDATDISATLKTKGFETIELYDPKTKRDLQDAIVKYFKLLLSKPNATGMVFYSGHGMQVDGSNYLIPTQANPQIKADIDDQCLNMDYVMQAIEQAGNPLNIFILDACRNNPFRGFSRSSENGLSMVSTPKGSYIVYATKPGSVASDGTGRNGLFTSKLLKHINAEGVKIEEIFKRVAADVSTDSKDLQRPWIASDYTGDFIFTPSKPSPRKIVPDDFGYGPSSTSSILVGKQEWISKNLNVSTFADGSEIFQAESEANWKKAAEEKKPAWCYFEFYSEVEQSYAKLYNWYAVSDPRGLAPKGWHIPKSEEWAVLIENFGGETEAGLSLKSDEGWLPIEALGGMLIPDLENLTKEIPKHSVLNFPPGGAIGKDGTTSYYIQAFGNWWSATSINTKEASGLALQEANNEAVRINFNKGMGLSVRCIKD